MHFVNKKTIAIGAGLLGVLAGAVGLSGASMMSCAATPSNTPIQSFEQPQNIDIVCLQVLKLDGSGYQQIPAIPQPESACAQVPVGVVGASLPYHLFALVTQETRGEVAVVDLTAGYVVDIDPNTPGTNLLPVGRLPSDIAATPDGKMVFVGSADPNSPSIFALPSTLILGNSQVFDAGVVGSSPYAIVPQLTTWPVCSLPQVPGAIRILPKRFLPSAADAGAAATQEPDYVIVAVLPGDTTHPARVVTVDPAPLLRGAAPFDYEDAGGLPDGDVVAPGSLAPCSLLPGEYPLTLAAVPAGAVPPLAGQTWDDGLGYDAGVIDADMPATAVACAPATDSGANAPSFTNLQPGGGATVLDTAGPRPLLYIADTALPLIHVIDLSDPTAPVELAPLQATSVADPSRVVSVGPISVSPTTRAYKRFLYAVDKIEGSLMVFDVTNPSDTATPFNVPLTRPHPEIDPFRPPDRLLFNSPIASVAFVQHDWPLLSTTDGGATSGLTATETGLLCNPNPNVNRSTSSEQGPFTDDGAYYRNLNSTQEALLGPARLRGVFAFATLTNGAVITIDVDDWDAPCRRPDPLAPAGYDLGDGGTTDDAGTATIAAALVEGPFSSIAPPQYSNGRDDVDPYHTPIAFQSFYADSPVSMEWYYPVSAPHRARSGYLLNNDITLNNGLHAPYLLSTPLLYSSGSPLATQGVQAVANPSLVPTDTRFVDPSAVKDPGTIDPFGHQAAFTVLETADGGLPPGPDGGVDLTILQTIPLSTPGVRFSWEDPEVQTDQDWTVSFEGALAGFFDGSGNPLVLANVLPYENFSGAWLSNGDAYFCQKGVEDFALGQQRARAENAALTTVIGADAGIQSFDRQVDDYVQLTDSILPDTDPYWTVDNACWSPAPADRENDAQDRYNTCAAAFGETLDPTTPNLQRDFPIIEAYNDRLLIGRFAYDGNVSTRVIGAPNWAVVGPDPTNAPFLKLMQCCFHNQVHFNVRTGGQWSVIGSASGFLHHIVPTGSDGRCGPSCLERDQLLNGRATPIARVPGDPTNSCESAIPPPSITRDSVLAFRNPMFSFLVWNGQRVVSATDSSGTTTQVCQDNPPARDTVWTFSTRGSFQPQQLNLAGTSAGLSPQSMRFIDSLGQLAIVDGSSQGLVLIDLNTLGEAHTPYY